MNRRKMANWWYAAVAVAAIAALTIPLVTKPTEEDPTGGAGLYAPMVAFCVALYVISQAINTGGLHFQRVPAISIGIGSLLSAYLWMADGAGVHSLDPTLPIVVAVLLAWAAIVTFVVPLLTQASQPQPDDSPSGENGDDQ